MKISLSHISKRFRQHWIFKDLSYTFAAPGTYALLGANGSGKSTLLRIIAGMQAPSLGIVQYAANNKKLGADSVFPQISFSAPGMELVEELTLKEFLTFHFSFKQPLQGFDVEQIIEISGLKDVTHKPIADYSSGMKQRVKLIQAIFSNTPALLLDEPCSNLDQPGVDQYLNWMQNYTTGRLVIIASNDEREYSFCKERLWVEEYI
jgi:ABC-type multidrug transport system ATPase subunit